MNKEEIKILDNELIDVSKIWQHQLHLEYTNRNRNVRVSFRDIGSFGELLAISYNPGYTGSGSGGMGLDLVNTTTKKSIEVKSCCTIQNSKCENKKYHKFNPLFHNKCPICNYGGKKISDSRFSINAKEFLDQYDNGFFDNFTLFLVQQVSHNEANKKIVVKLNWYKIDFNDKKLKKIKLDYFIQQAKKGKKQTCNLVPFSFDFYKLCPALVDIIYIELNYDDMTKAPIIKHEKTIKNPVRVPINILRDSEVKIFKKLSSYSMEDKEADVVDFTENIPYRKKTHGKNRGDTRKNAYRSVI